MVGTTRCIRILEVFRNVSLFFVCVLKDYQKCFCRPHPHICPCRNHACRLVSGIPKSKKHAWWREYNQLSIHPCDPHPTRSCAPHVARTCEEELNRDHEKCGGPALVIRHDATASSERNDATALVDMRCQLHAPSFFFCPGGTSPYSDVYFEAIRCSIL